MTEITTFDVLVVYSDKLAASANSPKRVITPFTIGASCESYNLVYAYFLEICQKLNLKAAFTTSSDIIAAGKFISYWLFENKTWIKVRKTCFSKLIFDKFSPTSKRVEFNRNLLFSSGRVKPFNNPYLFNLCFDKQKTYNKLHKFSIPTVTINKFVSDEINKFVSDEIKECTKKGIDRAYRELKGKIARHLHKDDFSKGIIMKNRFGSGGRNIYRFQAGQANRMLETVKKHKTISFIIQPFVKFDKGYAYQNSLAPTEIRLIYFGKKIVQTYIRMAKTGEFRCNEHRGGNLKYIPKKEVSLKLVAFSNNIAKILGKTNSLFALDFIISNNGNIYLLEANTKPGLDWNLSIKENEIEAKKLIRFIVKELVKRVSPTKKV